MRFGRLTAIGIDYGRGGRKTYWTCQCDCGNVKSVRSDSLLDGSIRSCGCLKREQDEKNLSHETHNLSKTRLYEIWSGIKARCFNKNNARWNRYGGRGITVCKEWNDDFKAFYDWANAYGYRNNLTIDRIDNDGDYSPENCRWVDNRTQCRNRSSNINIKIGNSTRTLTEWCEIFNLDYQSVRARYKRSGACGLEDLFNSGYNR